VSVNEHWEPAFIDSKVGAIHKLAKLESLAVYFDTDAASMSGLPHLDFIKKFTEQVTLSRNCSLLTFYNRFYVCRSQLGKISLITNLS